MIQPGQKLRLPRDDQLLVDPLYAAAAGELQRLQAGLIAAVTQVDLQGFQARAGNGREIADLESMKHDVHGSNPHYA